MLLKRIMNHSSIPLFHLAFFHMGVFQSDQSSCPDEQAATQQWRKLFWLTLISYPQMVHYSKRQAGWSLGEGDDGVMQKEDSAKKKKRRQMLYMRRTLQLWKVGLKMWVLSPSSNSSSDTKDIFIDRLHSCEEDGRWTCPEGVASVDATFCAIKVNICCWCSFLSPWAGLRGLKLQEIPTQTSHPQLSSDIAPVVRSITRSFTAFKMIVFNVSKSFLD